MTNAAIPCKGKLLGALLFAAAVYTARSEAGSSCIINPGTPTTWAGIKFEAMPSFDSRVATMAMCAPVAFSLFDSRFRTEAFAALERFRSDQPKGACLVFR